jgi:hypothetical protein
MNIKDLCYENYAKYTMLILDKKRLYFTREGAFATWHQSVDMEVNIKIITYFYYLTFLIKVIKIYNDFSRKKCVSYFMELLDKILSFPDAKYGR